MSGRKIAVVNDDTQFLTMMEIILSDAGYDVLLVVEASDAFQQICDWAPELVILDIRIEHPEGGWTILDLLRLERTTESLPVIVCSAAHDELQKKQQHLEKYNCIPLLKPFNIDDLLDLVTGLIGPEETAQTPEARTRGRKM